MIRGIVHVDWRIDEKGHWEIPFEESEEDIPKTKSEWAEWVEIEMENDGITDISCAIMPEREMTWTFAVEYDQDPIELRKKQLDAERKMLMDRLSEVEEEIISINYKQMEEK